MSTTPFTDPDLVKDSLYVAAGRLAQRTRALHAAKISGGNATTRIVNLAAQSSPASPLICDIGCGRGTITLALAACLISAKLIALDQSQALLNTVATRMKNAGHAGQAVRADFHHLPFPDALVDVAVAAFCLYHSSHPGHAIAEIARCLPRDGHAVLVTKSADSYHSIDQLITQTGLDSQADRRPSLYESFHSGIAPEIIATALRVEQVVHEQHVFRFTGLDHLAAYVATSPKYRLRKDLAGKTTALAEEFRRRIPDRPITTTSTVTYVVAARS